MKVTITQIESVTPSGDSGHVVVPKAWIGREAIIILKEKEKENESKMKKQLRENGYVLHELITNYLQLSINKYDMLPFKYCVQLLAEMKKRHNFLKLNPEKIEHVGE